MDERRAEGGMGPAKGAGERNPRVPLMDYRNNRLLLLYTKIEKRGIYRRYY